MCVCWKILENKVDSILENIKWGRSWKCLKDAIVTSKDIIEKDEKVWEALKIGN